MGEILKILHRINDALCTLAGNLQGNDFGVTLLSPPVAAPTGNQPSWLGNPVTGEVWHWNGSSWIYFSGGGGSAYAEVTYAEAEALIAGSTLVPGTLYKIKDRGDRGIFLKALSANQFSETGIRIMLVPKTYQTAIVDGNTWLGIWQPSLTPSIGDLVIWGAHVWENVSGNVGANANEVTLDAEWLLVDKEAYSNDEYIEMIFNVSYDFSNDWISKQWDGKGNKVGVPFEYTSNFNDYGYNFCDITDWNYATSGVPFVDNEAVVIFNNIIEESFAGNKSYGYEISGNTARAMYNNICVGGIIANVVDGRIYDNIVYSFEENVIGGSMIDNFTGNTIGQNTVTGSISFNTTMSSITYNTCNNVIYNTCIGRIESNIVSGNISYNSNSGAIYSNINSTVISYNSNAGDITENTGTGNISYNSNAGHISSNDCEEIYYNSNSGSIASNSNTGAITYNSNNGPVNINSNQGDIYLNSNNGSVADNSNSGDILNNSNNGNIETNSHNGNIIYNSNNGYIANCVGAGGFGVFNNINNGNINNPAGLAAADITDVIVNK